ncbi:MAG: hypothetical protein K0U98_08005 [Deltaproteobacteria bacterium]|nr:hypothetical protein [Deltaproteobacteria bacterium]
MIVLLFLGGCSDHWDETMDLVGQFTCGMSSDEIKSLVTPNRMRRMDDDTAIRNYVSSFSLERGPTVSLFFSRNRFYAVRISETVGLTKIFEHPRQNLCSGEKTIRVTAYSNSDHWAEGAVLLNDKEIDRLENSSPLSGDLELPLGSHKLHLEKDGKSSAVANLILTPMSSHMTVFFGEGQPFVDSDPPEKWKNPRKVPDFVALRQSTLE